ncbi:MAG: TIGR00730 family Rossman fold protein, partial [Sphingobacteriales bacterium]|nr:TIGR00730 family Rossman fold protein [Sphingobacteriales bacterium]
MNYSSVAVFCGSKFGMNTVYETHANELGKLIAQHEQTLVYGGGNVGLMGAVSNAVMANGGKVIGVIPEVLKHREIHHTGISELFIVADMHSRKKKMYELCDAAIILPGGFGTLDELFEMLTWNQLSIHDKKIILLNSGGYYDNMIAHLHQMEADGFLYEP